jgi:CHAT domain-containing protein
LILVLNGCRPAAPLASVYDGIEQKIQRGELDAAMAEIERESHRHTSKGADWEWSFRVLRAHVYIYRGEYKKTLIELDEPLPTPLEAAEIAVRKSIYEGVAYRLAQQYDASEKSFGKASLLAEHHHPELLAEVLNSRAVLESNQRRYTQAEATSRQALALSRLHKNKKQELSALASLGATDLLMERFDEALEWNQEGLKLADSMGRTDTAQLILGNMGSSYFQLGDFENAIPLFRQAAEDTGRKKLYDFQAHWLTDLAECYNAKREYGRAEEILSQALKISRQLEEKTALTECLNDLAEVALETGHVDEAERYSKEEAEVEHAGLDRSAILDSELIRGRIAAGRRNFAEAERLLGGIISSSRATMALKWEAHARLAKTLDDEGKTAAAEAQYQQAIGNIERARLERGREELQFSFLTDSIEFYEDYVDFLVAHGRTADALRVADLSRARTLVEGLAPQDTLNRINTNSLRPQQVAKKVGQSLLFYWIGRKQSHLWVITPSKTSYFALAKADEILPLVNSYRAELRNLHDPQEAVGDSGKKLYAMLVNPALGVLRKESRLTVLPDPSLASLNFETLIVPGPNAHFWIEDVTLTTASSLTLLSKASIVSPGRQEDKSLLVVGNTEPIESFPALAKAHEEMQRVEQYFPKERRAVLEGKQATPRRFLSSEPGKFTYLHFATHGIASVTKPLDSAVILSRDGDSYKLYARDIIRQPLTAKLVTISACEGASGRAYSGEGLVGLSWAFLRAGAHNVVGALWEVNDSAAPQIMDTFYRELNQGKDPATALRIAKLRLLRDKDPEIVFRKPYYWAAFQLYAGS